MTQFRKRSDPSAPVTREELQRQCDNWSRMCAQLDDYAIAGNEDGIERTLNRLYYSVQRLRQRAFFANGQGDNHE